MKCYICGRDAKLRRFYNGELRYMCKKHIAQLNFYGEITDASNYSIADKNEYEETDDGVWIICRNARSKEHEETGRFLVDYEDKNLVLAHKWRYWKSRFYTGNFKPITISRFLLGANESLTYVDHINGNICDNRRSNLRLTTPSENGANKHIYKNVISGIRFDDSRNAYAVDISFNKIRYRLGRFKSINDAVYCRYYAEQKIFKEHRCTTNDDKILPYINACSDKQRIEEHVNKKILNVSESR